MSRVAELPLPREVRWLVSSYLVGTRGDMSLALCLIQHGARERMKRCTLCPGCRRIRTYNQYCSACEQALWWD